MMRNTRIRLAVAAAALSAAAGLTAAAPAQAESATTIGDIKAKTTCSALRTVKVQGAKLKYIECWRTYRGKKQSSTAVKLCDKFYGEDPYARVKIGRWEATWTYWDRYANGGCSPKYISGWHNGADAKVYFWTA
ncbi:hypothetical protein [Streptomyces sp. NPDC053720]|uniref:hypothetical protein n=1 Tax=Streptomyces sp. NPDC053720 TaxID=3154855 RepID=UPI003414309A